MNTFGKKRKKGTWSLSKLKSVQEKYLVIKKSNFKGAGQGAFAKIDIPKGTRLGYYRGKELSPKEYAKLKDSSYAWKIDGPVRYIDAKPIKTNNKLRFINGYKGKSQKKYENVESYQYRRQIWYRTIKKVKKGDELIIDYGEEYWVD